MLRCFLITWVLRVCVITAGFLGCFVDLFLVLLPGLFLLICVVRYCVVLPECFWFLCCGWYLSVLIAVAVVSDGWFVYAVSSDLL